MSWYSTGSENAERMAASVSVRRTRNFFTKPGETATIRFLSPASESFNYKRAFVKWAKGDKLLTSPQTIPDPFLEAGLQLQAAFAWLIIDRRTIEFDDRQTGEKRTIGPRILYFADGSRTRKQLIAFEKEMLNQHNEELEEEGRDPVTLSQFNLTSYDLKASKEKGAPWNFVAKRPKELSEGDKELVEKYKFNLVEELAPLPKHDLDALLKHRAQEPEEDETTLYSYDTEEDTISFD